MHLELLASSSRTVITDIRPVLNAHSGSECVGAAGPRSQKPACTHYWFVFALQRNEGQHREADEETRFLVWYAELHYSNQAMIDFSPEARNISLIRRLLCVVRDGNASFSFSS
jgi:hypothetical protein